AATETAEASEPAPLASDRLVTARALERAWPAVPSPRLSARAAVIRTLPNPADKYMGEKPDASSVPYLSRQAMQGLVARGIAHLVLDLPSADRLQDGGALTAHRVFFGLPPGRHALQEAQRPACTLTELAYVDDALPDGWYLLSLQSPAIAG